MDWFAVALAAGTRYHIVVEETGDTTRAAVADVEMRLYTPDGTAVLPAGRLPRAGWVIPRPRAGRTISRCSARPCTRLTKRGTTTRLWSIRHVRRGGDEGWESYGDDLHYSACGATRGFAVPGEATRTVSLPSDENFEISDKPVAGMISDAGMISALGLEVFGEDLDAFAMDLESSKEYWLVAQAGDRTPLTTPVLVDVTGGCIGADAPTTTNADGESSMIFSPDNDGFHTVRISGDGNTGQYFLNLLEVGRVVVGGSATGDIEVEMDRDWFVVNLESGKTYQIDLKGAPTMDGTLRNARFIGVYRMNGEWVEGTTDKNGGEGNNSRKDYTADYTGPHLLLASGSNRNTGTYTLSVTEKE